MNKTRRHFSGPERVAILKRHLVEKTPVSDLCDELGISPSQFYRWQKEFFENGHAAFENHRKAKAVGDAKQRRIEQLEAKLQRKNEVLSELMEEHIQLKKAMTRHEARNREPGDSAFQARPGELAVASSIVLSS